MLWSWINAWHDLLWWFILVHELYSLHMNADYSYWSGYAQVIDTLLDYKICFLCLKTRAMLHLGKNQYLWLGFYIRMKFFSVTYGGFVFRNSCYKVVLWNFMIFKRQQYYRTITEHFIIFPKICCHPHSNEA